MNTPSRTAAAVVLAAAAAALVAGCGSGPSSDAKPAAATTRAPAHQADPEAHSPGPAPSATAHLRDPAAVVRAYLTASQTVTAADATAPPRRAEAYMAPDNAERGIGQPVYDAPPAGLTREPVDIKVTQAAAKGNRIVYQATYTPALTKDRHTVKKEKPATTYVVCEKQPDGTWLVALDDPNLTPEGID
ncbi:hypothetical protein ABZ851_36855 [Streptomyces sp. NPDC047049]|uniref:hypothetical protein n=1 Tax=Streptomyces sp. NPDC047049 TaxID=3156688 RepID=UPI0033F5BB9E